MAKMKLNAELWDKMHYMFREFNDRMVHVVLTYDTHIDIEALKTVLICFLEKIPVLHSSFVPSAINPYWEQKDYVIEDVLEVHDIENEEDLDLEIENFLMQYIPPEASLQIQVAVFNHGEKSTLCIVENHMCMDGGDLKYFLNSLCTCYTEYIEKGISPLGVRTGSRSYEEVYADMSPTEKQTAKRLYKNVSQRDKHKMPFTPDSKEDRSFIVKEKIKKEKFEKIRKAGKELGATVNDVLVAVFLHSMYEITDYSSEEEIAVSCAIDLRRHMSDLSDVGYTNHTAFMSCSTPKKGRNIKESIEFVKLSAQKNKEDKFMGLYGLPLLKLAYSIMPYAASESVIKIGYSNPLLGISNVGVLDAEKLSLCGHPPIDGFATGAVKYKPFSLLSATSLNGEMTIAMCERGNEKDKEVVKDLFAHMMTHFDELIGE